jgi:hypothetical protein
MSSLWRRGLFLDVSIRKAYEGEAVGPLSAPKPGNVWAFMAVIAAVPADVGDVAEGVVIASVMSALVVPPGVVGGVSLSLLTAPRSML